MPLRGHANTDDGRNRTLAFQAVAASPFVVPGTESQSMNAPMKSDEIEVLRSSAQRASRLLKKLANEQRLLILCKLLEGECAVTELSEHVQLAQSATSQHLAKLREAGLLATRRDAQSIYYRIEDEDTLRVLQALCEVYRPGMGEAA